MSDRNDESSERVLTGDLASSSGITTDSGKGKGKRDIDSNGERWLTFGHLSQSCNG